MDLKREQFLWRQHKKARVTGDLVLHKNAKNLIEREAKQRRGKPSYEHTQIIIDRHRSYAVEFLGTCHTEI